MTKKFNLSLSPVLPDTKNLQRIFVDEALTLKGVQKKQGRHTKFEDLGLIKNAVIIRKENQILFAGGQNESDLFLKNYFSNQTVKKSNTKSDSKINDIEELKFSGMALPGFVESHTHTVFAGDRTHEFELRNQGLSYQEIANRGGGIQFTMDQTKSLDFETLLLQSQKKLKTFHDQGVVFLETKSGYGIDLESELKILKVSEKLNSFLPTLKVLTTFLGLHSVPNKKHLKDYVQDVILNYLPQVHTQTSVRHADIFLDQGYFDLEDLNQYVSAIKKLGWTFSAHTDQLTSTGSGLAAAELGALSISHCVNMKDEEIKKVASTKTVFNLLPAADFYLKISYPKARDMIEAGGIVSLATDFNPGSSPTQNINFVGLLARLEMKMSLPEVIAAYTFNAAQSLNVQSQYGVLDAGFSPHFQIRDQTYSELFYSV